MKPKYLQREPNDCGSMKGASTVPGVDYWTFQEFDEWFAAIAAVGSISALAVGMVLSEELWNGGRGVVNV